jgi:hypothetical protein
MRTLPLALCAILGCLALPAAASAQAKPLRCLVDQFNETQLKSIGDGIMSGSDAAQAQIEGATASCATKYKPAQLNAAVQYANDTAVYEASKAQLKSLGAPTDLIDSVWSKVDPAQRETVAAALKAGDPPAALMADLQGRLPKGSDTLSLSMAALSGVSAKASMTMAEKTGG